MPTRTLRRNVVCAAEELPIGTRQIVEIDGRSIGVFHTPGDEFFALRNICPHHGAQLCLGKVQSTILVDDNSGELVLGHENRILRCPWHGYEFDLTTGRSLTAPDRWRVRRYDVAIEDGNVVVFT